MIKLPTFCLSVAALVVGFPQAAAGESKKEQRTITFKDGAPPKFEGGGERFARGPVELRLALEGLNPLCYRYVIDGKTRALPRPERQAGAPLSWDPPAPTSPPADLEAARTALQQARTQLEGALKAAQSRVGLDQVWAMCEGPGPAPKGVAERVDAAAAQLLTELLPNGSWRKAFDQAATTSDAVREKAHALREAGHQASQRIGRLESEAEAAKSDEQKLAGRLEAAKRTGGNAVKRLTTETEAARARLASAERDLEEAKRQVADAQQAEPLVRGSHELRLRREQGLRQLSQLASDVQLAKELIAQAPSGTKKTIATGEKAKVAVTRVPLKKGVPSGSAERFESESIEALHPILLDVSVGPALTFQYTEAYGLGVKATRRDPVARTRVVRTEEQLNLDGMVSLSAYVWGRRYLDDRVVAWKQLLPRPMLGLSMRQPFSSIYVGGQIDPIQFVDISFGARWFTRQKLLGPQVGDRALLDHQGRPAQPDTQDEVTVAPFVALSVSTDFVHRWLKRGL